MQRASGIDDQVGVDLMGMSKYWYSKDNDDFDYVHMVMGIFSDNYVCVTLGTPTKKKEESAVVALFYVPVSQKCKRRRIILTSCRSKYFNALPNYHGFKQTYGICMYANNKEVKPIRIYGTP